MNDTISIHEPTECLICGQPHLIASYYPAGDTCDACLDRAHQPIGMTYFEHIVASDDEGAGFSADYNIRRGWNLSIHFA